MTIPIRRQLMTRAERIEDTGRRRAAVRASRQLLKAIKEQNRAAWRAAYAARVSTPQGRARRRAWSRAQSRTEAKRQRDARWRQANKEEVNARKRVRYAAQRAAAGLPYHPAVRLSSAERRARNIKRSDRRRAIQKMILWALDEVAPPLTAKEMAAVGTVNPTPTVEAATS